MSRVVCAVLIVACCAIYAFADEEKLYSDKYDHLNVDSVLANDRLRSQYYNCFLGSAPCVTPDAMFFKERFPEAVVTKCRKCTERQKEGFGKIAEWFNSNDPVAWDAVIKKAVEDYTKKGLARKMEKTNS